MKLNPDYIRRTIGGASALLGLWWVWGVIYPFIRPFWTGEHGADDPLSFLMVIPFMALPGILALGFGISLFRKMTVSSLKVVVGVFAFFGTMFIASSLSVNFPAIIPEEIAPSAFLLLGCAIVITAYVAALWFILPYLAVDRPKLSSLIGRGALALMACQLWLFLSAIFREYSPKEAGYTHVPAMPWGILGVLVPIIGAYGAYRLAAGCLPPEQSRTERWRQAFTRGHSGRSVADSPDETIPP